MLVIYPQVSSNSATSRTYIPLYQDTTHVSKRITDTITVALDIELVIIDMTE